jgi:hypothetical protein
MELEINETADTDRSASYLALHDIDSGERLRTKLYDNRDNFNFPIVNFRRLEEEHSLHLLVCLLSVEKHVHQR